MNLEKTIENLRKNNMEVFSVKTGDEAKNLVKSLIPTGSIVAHGGSVSLVECGVADLLKNSGDYVFLDRFKPDATPEEVKDIAMRTKACDYYLSSSNAITENGELYNVDGTGNRVASLSHGPLNVIIVAGANKIVENLEQAVERVRNVAAPLNAKRLNFSTPCVKTGRCHDCSSPQRICCIYQVLSFQREANRIKVILVEESLGY